MRLKTVQALHVLYVHKNNAKFIMSDCCHTGPKLYSFLNSHYKDMMRFRPLLQLSPKTNTHISEETGSVWRVSEGLWVVYVKGHVSVKASGVAVV